MTLKWITEVKTWEQARLSQPHESLVCSDVESVCCPDPFPPKKEYISTRKGKEKESQESWWYNTNTEWAETK